MNRLPTRTVLLWTAAGLLLGLHAWLAVDALRATSPTVDEVAHLPAGISYLHRGTFALYHQNPPLAKQLAALAALSASPVIEEPGTPLRLWPFAWGFQYANAARYHEIFERARLPGVALSVLAGLAIFLWAREAFGAGAALLSLAVWCLCPNVIAHAGLVTTDIGAASIGFVATWLFAGYLKSPSKERLFLAGVFLGLAQLTKFTMLLLYPVWIVGWLLRRVSMVQSADAGSAPGTGGILAVLALSVFVINVGYGFEGTGERLGSHDLLSGLLTRPRTPHADDVAPADHPWHHVLSTRQNRFVDTWLGALPVPLPRHYLLGFDEQKLEAEGVEGEGYPVYLLGEMRRQGWWWYFLVALGVKLPLGTWLLTALAASLALRKSGRVSSGDEAILLLAPLALLFGMSFLTDVNLGVRYVLPALPFWFVSLGRVAHAAHPRRMATTFLVALAILANAAALRYHPHHLAYFNELAGGPEHGGEYLIDSNLDWGQDLRNLAAWLREERPGETVGLAYFGGVAPAILEASGSGFPFRLAPAASADGLELRNPSPGSRAWRFLARWEQENMPALRAWAQSHPGRSPFTMPALREALGDALAMPVGPQPGLFAVSANFVYGLPFRIHDEEGNIWSTRENAFGYVRKLSPIAKVGYSIFVYEVSRDQADGLRREMGLAPLPAGESLSARS